MFNNEKLNKIEAWRIKVIYVLIALVFGYYVLRLFNLQIISGETFLAQADDNRTNEINIQSELGVIYDRNGIIFARNVASYNVAITPANLPGDPTEVPLPGAVEAV